MDIKLSCPLNKKFSYLEDKKIEIISNINNILKKIKSEIVDKTLNIFIYNNEMQFKKVESIKGIEFCAMHSGTYIFVTHENNKFVSNKIIFYGSKNTCIIKKSQYMLTSLTIDMAENSCVFIDTDFSCGICTLRLRENKNIFIGKDNMFSSQITIWTSDGHAIIDQDGNIINDSEDVILGDHVWLGFSVNILKGAFINDGSLVGLGSLVNKKFYEPNCVIAGAPARIIKNKVRWNRKNPTHLRQYAEKVIDSPPQIC